MSSQASLSGSTREGTVEVKGYNNLTRRQQGGFGGLETALAGPQGLRDSVTDSEASAYKSLEKKVLADERQRRLDQGLPAEKPGEPNCRNFDLFITRSHFIGTG